MKQIFTDRKATSRVSSCVRGSLQVDGERGGFQPASGVAHRSTTHAEGQHVSTTTRINKAGLHRSVRRLAMTWKLRLYVAGTTPKSVAAFDNLKKLCDEHLACQYSIEVVDLLKNPKLARGDQILAVPTLVRQLPRPLKKIIGDLSNKERVLVGLDLRSR